MKLGDAGGSLNPKDRRGGFLGRGVGEWHVMLRRPGMRLGIAAAALAALVLLALQLTGNISVTGRTEGAKVYTIPLQPDDADEVDGITAGIATDQTSYGRDEPVAMALVVVNNGSRRADFLFRSGQKFDFTVKQDGRTVWKWSSGRFFTAMLQDKALAPGDFWLHVAVWDGTDNSGRRVRPGRYQLTGELTASPGVESQPVTVELR